MARFTLIVTNRCNLSCKTCMRVKATREDLDPVLARSVLKQVRELGVEDVAITGGEPILHPRLGEIVAAVAENGMKFNLVTNGSHTDRCFAVLEPFRANVRHIAVSLDGHTADIHDANRRRGSFAQAVDCVNRSLANGYKVLVAHVLNHHNAEHVLEFMKFVSQWEVDVVLGTVLATDRNRAWTLTPQQRGEMRMILPVIKKAYGGKVHVTTSVGVSDGLIFCRNFREMNDIALRFDNKVCVCCDSLLDNAGAVMGDLSVEPFAQVLAQFGTIMGRVLSARIFALAEKQTLDGNACDFCNEAMAGGHRPVATGPIGARRARAHA